MGAAHRTAARIVSRGVRRRQGRAPLAMDTHGGDRPGHDRLAQLDRSPTRRPGMSSYVTGHKGNNNQEGVYPDNTADRVRQPARRVPRRAAAAHPRPRLQRRHRDDRRRHRRHAGRPTPCTPPIATRGDRASPRASSTSAQTNGVTVLLGGGARLLPAARTRGGTRTDDRDLVADFRRAGYAVRRDRHRRARRGSAGAAARRPARPVPPAPHVGRVRQGRRRPLQRRAGARAERGAARPADARRHDARWRWRRSRRTRRGLLPDGRGRVDRQAGARRRRRAHHLGHDRVRQRRAVALEFARAHQHATPIPTTTPSSSSPPTTSAAASASSASATSATRPQTIGAAVRDYAAVFRFTPAQTLQLLPELPAGRARLPASIPIRRASCCSAGPPRPIASRTGCRTACAPGRHAVVDRRRPRTAVANPARDGADADSDNARGERRAHPGLPRRRHDRERRDRLSRPAGLPRRHARRARTRSPATRPPTCRSRPTGPGHGSSRASTTTPTCS